MAVHGHLLSCEKWRCLACDHESRSAGDRVCGSEGCLAIMGYWSRRYMFEGACLPRSADIEEAVEGAHVDVSGADVVTGSGDHFVVHVVAVAMVDDEPGLGESAVTADSSPGSLPSSHPSATSSFFNSFR
jgi:hypothetical protein